MNRTLVLLSTILVLGVTTCTGQEKFRLIDDDVVTFLGGTNMVRLVRSGDLETILTASYAQQRPRFRDLSWEADTVYQQGTVIERWRKDGFGDFSQQLDRVETTVAFAQFGQMESLDGLEPLPKFIEAYEQLVYRLSEQTRMIVILSPTRYEQSPFLTSTELVQRNNVLSEYVKAIGEMAQERGVIFVNLFEHHSSWRTDNGVHLSSADQLRLAKLITAKLEIESPPFEELRPLQTAIREKHRLWYDYWRPANWKLLYGDDKARQFTRGGEDYIPFREEWQRLVPMIESAEDRVWAVANGENDPGPNRPQPEVLHGDDQADIEGELASFEVSDGLQVNLFASDREGLTSPLAVRWDPAGRMYVAITTTYPHIYPGDMPNDKIIVLEDLDGDGAADRSTVFADGLNIPTGMELGDGGVYVGQNTELLFLKDLDGDLRADERRIVLGGLGNGDSHQTCNSFVWSPGGELFFGQGDGCESRVETPWGISGLYQAGFFRFRPRQMQLHPLLDDFMGPGNPWGVVFDEWGQIFSIDGAGGVTYLSPGQVPTSHRLRLRTIGDPGGYCGIDRLDGRHLPESMHGDFVVGDFKANRIKRFSVERDGAGYRLHWKEPLLQSSHRNFRPVDVRVGPDGAIYIVDWYNPITCHQDDAYRDPTRDKAHGRIWRISSDAPSTTPPDLSSASLDVIVASLASPEHWTRYQAKRALTTHQQEEVTEALGSWIASLDPSDPKIEHHLFEALGAFATVEVVEPGLLMRLLRARDSRARAYAARLIGRWHDRLDDPLELLKMAVTDHDAQVRMEAIIACASIPEAASITIAARATELPIDEWTEYAFTQTVQHLKPIWYEALQDGQLSFAHPNHFAAVLGRSGERNVLESLEQIVSQSSPQDATWMGTVEAIIALGGPEQWSEYALNQSRFRIGESYDVENHAKILASLVDVARADANGVDFDVANPLLELLHSPNSRIRLHALRLAELWKVSQADAIAKEILSDDSQQVELREAAMSVCASLDPSGSRPTLIAYAQSNTSTELRIHAVACLVPADLELAADLALNFFQMEDQENEALSTLLRSFLSHRDGVSVLAPVIESNELSAMAAKSLLRNLFATGFTDQKLISAITSHLESTSGPAEYSQEYIADLAEKVRHVGDTTRGEKLFHSIACGSCHRVGGSGGEIGPDLSAIGTTLSTERIIEELLWPNRQVKEGYSVLQVVTLDGKVHVGYERNSRETQANNEVLIQDLSTGRLISFSREELEDVVRQRSSMPQAMTAILEEDQLLDLIRYLTELGRLNP